MDQKESEASIDEQNAQPRTEAAGTNVLQDDVPDSPQFSSLHVRANLERDIVPWDN
jgi:hypothetical protein